MSNIVKWALLAAGIVALIALVMALPVGDLSLIGNIGGYLNQLMTVCGTAFNAARGLINFFLFEPVRPFLTGLLMWLFAKWAITIGVKITAWVYHFVFRG
jgi:hypothetical protein